MLPNFIVIGAQKSATSWLVRCLMQHPEIFLLRREAPFFESPNYCPTKVKTFESLFSEATTHKAIGFKRPDLMFTKETPQNIYRHLPEAKLICVLRDPIDRVVSAYFWYMRTGAIPIIPLNDGLLTLIKKGFPEYPLSNEIITAGFYYEHLQRYLKFFKRNQLLILLFDEIQHNPQQCFQNIYSFLGVDNQFVPVETSHRPKSAIYSLGRIKWLSFRHPIIYDRSTNGKVLKERRRNELSMGKKIFNGFIVGTDRILLSKILPNVKPKLDNHILSQLQDIYQKDTTNLAVFLDKDLIGWKSSQKIIN